jgi:hypothetical protein
MEGEKEDKKRVSYPDTGLVAKAALSIYGT